VPSSEPHRPIRVVVAEESALVQAGLRGALEDAGMLVVAACEDVERMRQFVLTLRPDAVLLSASLPVGALGVMRSIRQAGVDVEFVLMADDPGLPLMLEAVHAGAHGFLLGKTDPERLPHAIAGVVAGEAAFPRRLVRAMADELAGRDRRRGLPVVERARLTRRELEVLDALAGGLSAVDVARRLQISHATVRRHAANAAHKLGAPSTRAAVGMVTPTSSTSAEQLLPDTR